MIAPPQPFLQVVHALVAGDAPQGVGLLALRDDAAYVHMRDGSVAIVINPSKRGEELEQAIKEQLGVDKSTHLKLVVIGGGAGMREVLGRIQPGFFSRRMVQTYHLGADGSVWGGERSSLDTPVGRALKEVGEGKHRDVSFDELAVLVPEVSPEEYAEARRTMTFVERFRGRRPPLTRGLLIGLLGAFVLEWMWGGAEYLPTLVRMGANTEASLGGEPWRLLSSMCLHGGGEHFLINGFVLWMLGGELERILGWARLSILLVLSGLAGSIASALLSDAALSVGVSGAIWGVLAGAGALALRPRGLLPPAIVERMRRAAGINLVINFAASFLPQVDLWAHLGGGLAGAALVLSGALTRGLAPLHEDTTAPDSPWLRRGAIASLAALGSSLVIAIAVGRPWELTKAPAMVERQLGAVAIDVPAPLGEPDVFESPDAMLVGASLANPITIEVRSWPRAPDDPFEFAPDLEGATRLEERHEIEGAPAPTYEERWGYESAAEQRTRYVFFPQAMVIVDVLMLQGTPQPWLRAAEETLDSVRVVEEGS